MHNTSIVTKFTDFCLNYNRDFISKAFDSLPVHMQQHLEGKFSECYERRGAYACMLAFYRELSDDNRALLINYITNK